MAHLYSSARRGEHAYIAGKGGSPKTPVRSSPRQMHISLTGPDIPRLSPRSTAWSRDARTRARGVRRVL